MCSSKKFQLTATTQGPLYPPSEVVDKDGNFIVVGNIVREGKIKWGQAIVDKNSSLPEFGKLIPYKIKKEIILCDDENNAEIELFSLPLPIPMNNYKMTFAPEQLPGANAIQRSSYPLNKGYIYDFREEDGRRKIPKINLRDWLKAEGELSISFTKEGYVRFDFIFNNLIPNSLYTVMSLREKDLSSEAPTRPGPLGIPNVFITDAYGRADYFAVLNNPFPKQSNNSNRIVNVIVLYMSSQQSYGGAIGHFGLGGDVQAQLKLNQVTLFDSFITEKVEEN